RTRPHVRRFPHCRTRSTRRLDCRGFPPSEGDTMIRVMLVDDQELIRTGFSLVLSAEEDVRVAAEAGTGAEALTWLRENNAAVDVILMDVRMPEMNGIDATAHIVREWPGVRVLVLTTF